MPSPPRPSPHPAPLVSRHVRLEQAALDALLGDADASTEPHAATTAAAEDGADAPAESSE